MRKISQAIIISTLILDVAVVFVFGLAVISSYEDGSLLLEPVFVNYSKGRVAGEAINNLQIDIIYSSDGATVSGPVTLKARTNIFVSLVHFNIKQNSAAGTGTNMPAAFIPGTAFDWEKTISNMPDGSYSVFAKAQSSDGIVLATSTTITINVLNNNTTINPPSITFNSPAGGTISGTTNPISGSLLNFPSAHSIPVKELQVWQSTTLIRSFSLTRDANNLIGNMDTTTLVNGDYTLKIHIEYNDGSTSNKPLDSNLVSVTVSNASATAGTGTGTINIPSIALGSPTGGTVTSTIPAGGMLSNFSTAYSIPIKELQVLQGTTLIKSFPLIRDANNPSYLILTGGLDTTTLPNGDYIIKIHIVYNDGTADKSLDSNSVNVTVSNASATAGTGTSTTPPSSQPTITINSPIDQNILRRNEPVKIKATSSAKLSSCSFLILKVGELAPQVKTTQAQNTTDKPSLDSTGMICEYDWDLKIFGDGDYKITAEGWHLDNKANQTISTAIQKFNFKWLAPNNNERISGNKELRAEINGIYQRDNKTPMNDLVVEFWQVGVKAPYPKYNGKAQQRPGTHEWFYEWKTINSPDGQYRIEARNGKDDLLSTAPLVIEVSNSASTSASSGTVNGNTNQNSNIAPKNTSTAASNTNSTAANANKAINSAVNTPPTTNANSNTEPSSSNQNSSVNTSISAPTDSDNDGLSDERETLLGTDPNNIDTDGDGFFDLEEVEGGYDPLKPPTDKSAALVVPKPTEEPKTAGVAAKDKDVVLVIEKIDNTVKKITQPIGNENINEPEPPIEENKIVLEGKGPPNQILTIFIYSVDPLVVTVKTDDDGTWRYELDKTLDDGEHEAYVTITDDTGKIQYKSTPISFIIKQARAESAEIIPAFVDVKQSTTDATKMYLMISGIVIAIVLILGAVLALRRKSNNTPAI